MENPQSIQRSINHWVRALSVLGTRVHELTVPSNTVFELTEDFFDGPQARPDDFEWFQVDGRSFEIFLDDDVTTMRLANKLVLQKLHGTDEHPLVSWFGYKSEAYDLQLHAPDDDSTPTQPDTNRLAWIGWDYRVWRTYLFDGGRVIPVTQSGATTAGFEMDVNRITWMGWDGEKLDIFTSEFPQVPATTAAVLVGQDDSVLAVHKPNR